MSKLIKLLRVLAPWLIAILLITLLFRRYPLTDVLAAAKHMNLVMFLTFILVYFVYISATDILSLHRVLRQFGINGDLNTVMELRLASNLAMILNYGAGQGVLAYFIKQFYSESFARVSSVLIFIILIDLYWAFTIAFAGSFFTEVSVDDRDLQPLIRILWAGATASGLAVIVFFRAPIDERRIHWIRARQLFHTFHAATLKDYFVVMINRLPLHLATCTYLYFLALCFGWHVSLDKVITLLPLTVVIGAIPITPSGLGTVQVSSILLFEQFIDGPEITAGELSGAEAIFVMSLMFTLGIYCLKLFTGTIFFRKLMQRRPDRG